VIASLRRNDLLRSDDNALALRRQTLSRSPSRIAASRRSALIFDTSDHSAAFTRIGEALAALPVDSTVLDGEAIFCASPPKRNRAYSSVTQLQLQVFETRRGSDLQSAFSAMGTGRVDAVTAFEDSLIFANTRAIVDGALERRLPSTGYLDLAEAGV
jgi:hypothetical protein